MSFFILCSSQIPELHISDESECYSKVEYILCPADSSWSLHSGLRYFMIALNYSNNTQGISVVLKISFGCVNFETALLLRSFLFFFLFMICIIANVISVLRLLVVFQVILYKKKRKALIFYKIIL